MPRRLLTVAHLPFAVGLGMAWWSIALAAVIDVWQSPFLIGLALMGFDVGFSARNGGE